MAALGFNETNGSSKSSKVDYMTINTGENRFRMLPNAILPGYDYWVEGYDQEGKKKNLPFPCLQFDRANERFDNTIPCPIRAAGLEGKNFKKETVPLPAKYAYKCLVWDYAESKVVVLSLKKTVFTKIKGVAKQLKSDPTDLVNGFDIFLEKKKTGSKVWDVEYDVLAIACSQAQAPVEDPDQLLQMEEAKDIEELFPYPTYEEQEKRLAEFLNPIKQKAGSDEVNDANKEDISDM